MFLYQLSYLKVRNFNFNKDIFIKCIFLNLKSVLNKLRQVKLKPTSQDVENNFDFIIVSKIMK